MSFASSTPLSQKMPEPNFVYKLLIRKKSISY